MGVEKNTLHLLLEVSYLHVNLNQSKDHHTLENKKYIPLVILIINRQITVQII